MRELLCTGLRCVIGCSHLPECTRFGFSVRYRLPGHPGCTTFLWTGRLLLAQLHVVTEMHAHFKSLTALKEANVCVINEAIHFQSGQLSFYPRSRSPQAVELSLALTVRTAVFGLNL